MLGEFSGVHLNLKKGLIHLGHDVVIASTGDGYKRLEADINLYTRQLTDSKIGGVLKEMKSQFRSLKKMKNFDIIQPTTFEFFHNRIDNLIFERVIKNNRKAVMLNTSCTTPYNKFVNTLNYSACSDCKKYDLKSELCTLELPRYKKIEFERYKLFDAFVSTHFEYFNSFDQTNELKKRNHFIPLPFDASASTPNFSSIDDKIVIYYGELRKGFKGGLYIEQALDLLQHSPYAKHFEIIRTKRLSFAEYQTVLKKAHVLIDQSSSYSYGMNALYGLANGKIVMTGAENEAMQLMGVGIEENPFINILPNPEHIYNKFVQLLEQKETLLNRSQLGVEFVSKFHNIDLIALQYENLYSRLLN